jgi:signal transduction histidine kinase/ligand-binding sensor domain-containing protein/CheY-like chemotaxis protein
MRKKTCKLSSLVRIFSLTLYIIVSWIFLNPARYLYSHANAQIEHISLEEGLSQSSVYCILQESKGFLWFATEEGLDRYDGYDFKVYKRHPGDPKGLKNHWIWTVLEHPAGVLWLGTNGGGLHKFDLEKETIINYQTIFGNTGSLSSNIVYSIGVDPGGMLWVGTANGLNRFDPAAETFKRYRADPANPGSLKHNDIRAIFTDHHGTLWIGTAGGGLNKYDPKSDTFTHYLNDPFNEKSLSHNSVRCIYEDRSGTLWIGTAGGGLNQFDREKGEFTHYLTTPVNSSGLNPNETRTIYEDRSGNLWIGTQCGLYIFDRENHSLNPFQPDEEPGIGHTHQLNRSPIRSIYEDRSGIFWIGTHLNGLHKIYRMKKKFSHYYSKPDDGAGLSDNQVWAIREDRSGDLWIGTSNGLNKTDVKREKFLHYRNEPSNPNSLSHNSVMTIYEDRGGQLWIGTRGGGLNRFNRENGTFTRYQRDNTDLHTLSNNMVMTIYEDRPGDLWIGTYGGLNKFDKKSESFTRYLHDAKNPGSISHDEVLTIYEDNTGILWIGTFGAGLNKFDRETETFVRFKTKPGDGDDLGESNIYLIHQDRSGIPWIGTDGGLYRYNPAANHFTRYGIEDGLPNEVIYGMLEDEQGNFWLSTNKGLSRFNPAEKTFRNFDTRDGLQSNEFNFGAFYKSKSGEMFFGGINGLNSFFPADIKINRYKPPIVITGLMIFNESVATGEPVRGMKILDKDISRTEEIRLSYNHSVFSFVFAGLNYALPGKNQYAYKMEGLEEEWNYVGDRRFATYAHVSPGEYVFRVKGSNNDGVWNEEGASLKIIIIPPFWKTWWFYLACALGLLILGLGIHRLRVRQLKKQEKRLTQLVKERTKELEQANRYKSEFLARMSHEIRTPMNSIIGFADLALDTTLNEEQIDFITSIKQSGESLLTIINEILDLSKIEAGLLSLQSIDFDPEVLAFNVCDLVIPRIGKRPIEVLCRIDEKLPANVKGDPGRFRQVLTNLMGNAVKFTREGEVELSIQVEKEENHRIKLYTKVRDTGIGISQHKKELIFEAFQQADITDTRQYDGTGLGLSISKQIAAAMGGDIRVESEPGKGSTFHFTAWVEKSFKKPTKKLFPSSVYEYVSRKKVLLVDDNPNCLTILEKPLASSGFRVLTNTKAGETLPILLEAAKNNDPVDLCVLDLNMPVMNGFEVAKQIRDNPGKEISQVPLLAISSAVEGRFKKYHEVGFDAFLPKPIRRDTLLEIITQLLGEKKIEKIKERRESILTQHSLMEDAKQSVRILMAEDNELNRKLASFVLNKAGYRLEVVTNGKEAVETFLADPGGFDLILMDIQMPEMNGKDAARMIREKGFIQIPIIAMTAASMKGDREKCLEAGMNDYVPKPIKRESLYQAIKKWVLDNRK